MSIFKPGHIAVNAAVYVLEIEKLSLVENAADMPEGDVNVPVVSAGIVMDTGLLTPLTLIVKIVSLSFVFKDTFARRFVTVRFLGIGYCFADSVATKVVSLNDMNSGVVALIEELYTTTICPPIDSIADFNALKFAFISAEVKTSPLFHVLGMVTAIARREVVKMASAKPVPVQNPFDKLCLILFAIFAIFQSF